MKLKCKCKFLYDTVHIYGRSDKKYSLYMITFTFVALCGQAQNKIEEKKASVNSGSKESDGKVVNAPVHIKQSPYKAEDTQAKNEIPKPKSSNQSSKTPSDNSTAILASAYKPETKVTSLKTNKRKSRELKDLKGTSAIADEASKPKRNRIQTQPYQSPLPEIALLVKSLNKTPGSKAADDKLIVFYKYVFYFRDIIK